MRYGRTISASPPEAEANATGNPQKLIRPESWISRGPRNVLAMRPKLLRSDKNPYTVDQYFDPTQFVPQQPFTLRAFSSKTADLCAPGIDKWDTTVQKSVAIREGITFKAPTARRN